MTKKVCLVIGQTMVICSYIAFEYSLMSEAIVTGVVGLTLVASVIFNE